MSEQLCGFLNLNKPVGWTSRDVVNVVQGIVRPAKAGHAGTLDPLATGVLVVAVGRATRLIEYAQQGAKQYRAEFQLGRTSETEDVEAEVVLLDDPPIPELEQIRAACEEFIGDIMQRPPAYSALKIHGKRAYDLARAGKRVEIPPRAVRIDAVSVTRYDYPRLELEIACGSGTYIRSLGRDLAAALGTGCVMSALKRTAVGPFKLHQAVTPDQLDTTVVKQLLLPPATAVSHLPRQQLNPTQIKRLAHGQPVRAEAETCETQEYAVLDNAGNLLGIIKQQRRHWKVARNVAITAE